MKKRNNYYCTLTVTLDGATAYVDANSIDEAKDLFEAGKWNEIEWHGADFVDWSINSVTENE